MRTTGLVLLVFVGLLLASSAAMAQVGGEPVETPVPVEETPAETPRDETPAATVSETSTIPGKAIGIGLGYVFPADVTVPNAASVRFRMASGLTAELMARIEYQGTTVDNEPDIGAGTTDGQGTFNVELAALGRKPMATRGRFQFVLLTGVGIGFSSETDDPDGADNSTTDTALTLAAVWGLGIDWFFRNGWSFTLSAVNPLFSLTRAHDDGLFNDQTITSFSIGAVFDPTIQAMFHLYF
jgi:hypothetical protein